jgi:hypothetical protein
VGPVVGETADPVAEEAAAPGESTGDARVDQAMGRLERLGALPVGQQVAEYEEIHRSLQDTLATVDEA